MYISYLQRKLGLLKSGGETDTSCLSSPTSYFRISYNFVSVMVLAALKKLSKKYLFDFISRLEIKIFNLKFILLTFIKAQL